MPFRLSRYSALFLLLPVLGGTLRTELPPSPPGSPRLAALAARSAQGDRSAVQRFWDEIAREGTPLVEPSPEGGPELLLTFLWRGQGERGVILLGSIGQGARLVPLAGTDVWYLTYRVRRDLRFTYRLAPVRAALPLDPGAPGYDLNRLRGTAQVDPLNHHPYPPGGSPLLSRVELPEAPPDPWGMPRPGVARGRIEHRRLHSRILGGVREVAVYTPPGYRPDAAPSALLVFLDGSAYLDLVPTPTILDNLQSDRASRTTFPPVLAVFVGRLEADERERDLSCSPAFTAFLAQELLPWARQRYRISPEAARTVLVGSSLGGLAAGCAAVQHPEIFGGVLAQSGSFQWKPAGEREPEWLRRRILASPRLPVRFRLDVGLLETQPAAAGVPPLLDASRRLRDALRTTGAEVDLDEYAGGHGYANWRVPLADDLRALLAR